jgi:hypothetical protein
MLFATGVTGAVGVVHMKPAGVINGCDVLQFTFPEATGCSSILLLISNVDSNPGSGKVDAIVTFRSE